MTPNELNIHIREYAIRMQAESEERLTLAYLTAAWSRADKLPTLKSILSKVDQAQKPKQTKSPEQMLDLIKNMTEQ